ncbi:unnamed protein product [Parnassius apollo]|uniref:(apollo) hypothetical protein n=1 Tax=Parnassius apollo TaxID=110799 RepID=A0A8S3WXQ2_PARAO|nr:unnamed protein product [Parnassius apollo]
MPDTRAKPVPASELSASEEETLLEEYLQRQLEDDVARIFDESIYSDLEVACGKLKILTHSCILKARTNKFYQKLETFLHVNIGRDIFDEIYSFISDAYVECNIKNQEKEIIKYLNEKLKLEKIDSTKPKKRTDIVTTDEQEVFLTPKCLSPYTDKQFKNSCLSPSTELTREYYALVPIDGNLLDQELNEQDALSNAFQSIINTQAKEINKPLVTPRIKPTTLSLTSSHTSKIVKHSNSCDNLVSCHYEDISLQNEKVIEKKITSSTSHKSKVFQGFESSKTYDNTYKSLSKGESAVDKIVDPTYSPDSLITDDPSSSSDYLSAAYNYSPGISSTVCLSQLNVADTITKMDNIFISSDSGLENTGLLESLSSHIDITLTDISLTESTLHELTDDLNQPQDIPTSPTGENQFQKWKYISSRGDKASLSGTSTDTNNGQKCTLTSKIKDTMASNSSKEEKQRQNEEIVILESSSVSSETGSWESVFPQKLAEKEICEKFINDERQFTNDHDVIIAKKCPTNFTENLSPRLVQKCPIKFKSTSCFVDAASLVDEEDDTQGLPKSYNVHEKPSEKKISNTVPAPSQPLPCATVYKQDISPNDWSESNEIDDSLEQGGNRDSDSIQKDLSPTIFEITRTAEESLSAIGFQNSTHFEASIRTSTPESDSTTNVFTSETPHNSILSLVDSTTNNKLFNLEESETDMATMERDLKKCLNVKYNESSPIISGGASIEDHLPQNRKILKYSSKTLGGTLTKFDICNNKNTTKTGVSAWVVDMSDVKSDDRGSNVNISNNKPGDRTCETLKNEYKCSNYTENFNKTGSVDSDSSEKSSHKFYIDLSSLPDSLPVENNRDNDILSEKKNIFSMYIDLTNETQQPKNQPNETQPNETQPNETQPNETQPNETQPNETQLNETKPNEILEQSVDIFEKLESLCNDPNVSISEIIAIPQKQCKTNDVESSLTKKIELIRDVNGDKIHHTLATTVIEEEPVIKQSPDLFVKLSDLDKPVNKTDIKMSLLKQNKGTNRLDVRMTRSIPENNWKENHASTSRSTEIMSSFHSENALSLNRLFPNLKNELSKSMPGSLSGRTQFPLRQEASSSHGELDEQTSDMSELSSVQSSICRSVNDSSTEDTSQTSSLIASCQSRLGQDLLRMFLEEIATDVVVEVAGKRIKAHKCILSSRCQYFAAMLSGGWVESAGNVILLPPFSHNVIHFALCHIYSGVSVIPNSISIVELATLADMLCLEGLKEVIMLTLKTKYCHNFHRPCQVCTAGVLECFPLTSAYGLDDLYHKCLRWITKYFTKVWPTKAFATLPKVLLEKCYQEQITNFNPETFIDIVYGCGIIVASLQNSRWAENVAYLCKRLINAAAYFASRCLVEIFKAISSMPAEAPQPAVHALDECLATAIQWAPTEEACRAYAFLSGLVKDKHNQFSKPDLINNDNEESKDTGQSNLLYSRGSCWQLQCEGVLVRAAPRVVGTQAFYDLPYDLRKRLRELGCITYDAQAIPVNPSHLQGRKNKTHHHNKMPKLNNPSTSRSLDMEHVRALFVPYASKPVTQVSPRDILKSNNELRDLRKPVRTIPPKVRMTKAQEERAKYNLIKNKSQESINTKPQGGRQKAFQNTKPRYLEPRTCKDNDKKISHKTHLHKMISSSESSRNVSPVEGNVRASRAKTKQVCESKAQAMSQDSLATSSRPRTAEPSTDSLSESQASNKYATYTKRRHKENARSTEPIKIAKCQSAQTVLNNAGKTKIPVLASQISKSENHDSQRQYNSNRKFTITDSMPSTSHTETTRKVTTSLMNPTKASQAKMVPKITKECKGVSLKQSKHATKHMSRQTQERVPDLQVIERSETFLKDEPTFGDKTSNPGQ